MDAILALTINLNASKQIIDSRPSHSSGPFSSPLGMPSLDFESVCPPHFTPACPTPLVLPSHRPPGWHCTTLPLFWPSVVKEKVDFKKWLHVFENIFAFIHKVNPFQCFLVFFDSFHFRLFVDSCIFPLVCKSILKTR